jgi:glycosyltransferase involved in cell wall biosynthesis
MNPDITGNNLTVLIDTTPLNTGHAIRGIGAYTRLLTNELEKIPRVSVLKSSSIENDKQKKLSHIVHFPFFDLFFATLPLKIFKPSVVTIHDTIPLRFPKQYPSGIRGKYNLLKQKLALKSVSAVITDSHSSKKDIMSFLKVPESKIHVIYLAANPELSAQSSSQVEEIRNKYHLPKKYVLYVGDINYNKNIPQLIKMMKFLPDDINLVCVGSNFTEQEIPEWKWIETQLALSNVGNRVHFLTNVLTDSSTELAALYSGAQCYVQPSLWEGFGLPVLEAMQCRTPVVSSNKGSLPEIGGAFVIYSEPKAQDMATKVLEVASWSNTKRIEKTRAAFAWNQNFSWGKTAQETLKVYQDLIK